MEIADIATLLHYNPPCRVQSSLKTACFHCRSHCATLSNGVVLCYNCTKKVVRFIINGSSEKINASSRNYLNILAARYWNKITALKALTEISMDKLLCNVCHDYKSISVRRYLLFGNLCSECREYLDGTLIKMPLIMPILQRIAPRDIIKVVVQWYLYVLGGAE